MISFSGYKCSSVLILYLADVPHSFINSSSFLVVSLRFFVYSNMSNAVTVLLPFHSRFLSLLSLFWLLWLRLSVLCWVKFPSVSILILFVILEEMLLTFHHWLWCYLWVCHIYPLLHWVMFPVIPLSGQIFNHKWMLNFIKSLFMSFKMII